MPWLIRGYQAQAIKAREFELFCTKNIKKLILAPAGNHRGTGVLERLLQTTKRRLAELDFDPNCSQRSLSKRLAQIIENIRLIPNATKQISPFEAYFGRKPNREVSNIVTNPSHKNFWNMMCSHTKKCGATTACPRTTWTQYRELEAQTPVNIESNESDNRPLRVPSPRSITPSEIHFTLGDITTQTVVDKRNVARRSIARKTKESWPTLAPKWIINPDGTITNYTSHTVTVETPLIKKTQPLE